ncbi:MAG: proline dehydrogenase family protein [Sphingobacteriia bacterium]|nr:proline dehydrogenase family protein [Sphingobacteriia bacterium]
MKNPSFENTEIAFASQDNASLKRAYLLFKALSNPMLVKYGNKSAMLAFRLNLPVKAIIKSTIYRQFVGGESIEECRPVVSRLSAAGVGSILDYSVEGKESREDMIGAFNETMKSLLNASENKEKIPFAVFKPTAFIPHSVLDRISVGGHLSEDDQEAIAFFRHKVEELCKTAYEKDVPILIDAEDSWYQPFIDDVVTSMMLKFNKKRAIVYNTLQMYRHDRLAWLKNSLIHAETYDYYPGYKFVRGAYMEKERERAKRMGYNSPIQPDKSSTDRDYNAALMLAIDHIGRASIFAGSHNEESMLLLSRLIDEKGLQRNDSRIWFSQLYGMSDHISFNLAEAGYNVAKYLPYGPVKHVLPYLARRAEENTSVKGQTGRELSLISTELRRRKGA